MRSEGDGRAIEGFLNVNNQILKETAGSRALQTSINPGLTDLEAEYRGPFQNIREERGSRDFDAM